MKEQLEAIRREALDKIDGAADLKALQDIKVTYLGKKGSLTSVLRGMGSLSKEERPAVGEMANNVREAITNEIAKKTDELEKAALEEKLEKEAIDVTLPGRPIHVGGPHLLTSIIEEIEDLLLAWVLKCGKVRKWKRITTTLKR